MLKSLSDDAKNNMQGIPQAVIVKAKLRKADAVAKKLDDLIDNK